ncbi:MAG: FAD-dependent oxidoreductase [Myxococcota bacterium]
MPRTPLLRALRALVAAHREAARTGLSVEHVRAPSARTAQPDDGTGLSRRGFLAGSAVMAAGAMLPWSSGCSDEAQEGADPRIVIIGAGISGLTAALYLKDAGHRATVYDMATHVGGRMVSERGSEPTGCAACHAAPATAPKMSWDDAQVTDIYGELIDTGHTTVQDLAKRFGLSMVNALAAEPKGATETYFFNGAYYPRAQADQDFGQIYDALQKDAEDAGWPTTWDSSTEAARKLDAMSLHDWIESRVPGGHTSPLGKLLDVAYTIEFGAETTDQSALNLVSMLSGAPEDSVDVFGESDEALRIQGGVDQLPRRIADHLGIGSTVRLGWSMDALRKEADGTYTLTFTVDGNTEEVRADVVVLALPFAKLRTLDIAKAGFDERKMKAINELGTGRNGKIHLQFKKRLWNEAGPWGVSGGTTYSDTGAQLVWDPTRGQAGTGGILAGYTGGDATDAATITHPYKNNGDENLVADANRFLTQIEPIFPGITALWNGKAAETMAHMDPRFNGSYAYWRVGQCQTIAGYERVRQGNVFFCGEHTSVENQGFMEGAASEGIRAADEIRTTVLAQKA